MKPISLLGILLVVCGALALAYQGINYNRRRDVLDVGPLHVATETHERLPMPPILGGMALAAGAALLIVGAQKTR
jgi:hypothetical protein